MNSKSVFAFLAVLIILGLGAFYFMNGQNTTTQSVIPSETTYGINPVVPTGEISATSKITDVVTPTVSPTTVTYTGLGFSPPTLTVKVGVSVTWLNNDTNPMWVASDPHPLHTGLPGFDALKGVNTGESYTYTFDKAGTWGYHNHLKPENTGKVIVTP